MTGRSFYSDQSSVNPLPVGEDVNSHQEKSESSSNVIYVDGKVINTHPALETYSRETRTWISDKASSWTDIFNSYKARAAFQLAKADSQYHQIILEPLLPQSLYVITATLTGSILARRRSLSMRFISPILFGIVSFGLFMPKSSTNCSQLFINLEAERFPDLKKMQDEASTQVHHSFNSFTNEIKSLQPKLTEVVKNSREAVENWARKK
ncbi:hypothetical protein FOA43_004114 [Brettanomyces nanus]|uniref:MICOS complex subunit n=1 Tax=Eeniella nana TaxID=13502 RepID=A0A875RQE8_EENNA|nr:uncharacterized protein FOA43_004114 [Brettanomyces nanus]QPG76720.1 hypothetical protein FOA43_004114 [Brettanomyces nanus]